MASSDCPKGWDEGWLDYRRKGIKMKIILLIALMLSNSLVSSQETSAPFKITHISVHNSGNMPFRAYGMPAMSSCPGSNFGYIAENDTTSNAKISTLLAAFSAQKFVTLAVAPVNFFGNGTNYCQIIAVGVSQ